jgi:hypothetical protein
MLRIRDVLSPIRIRTFLIPDPDPNILHPGSYIIRRVFLMVSGASLNSHKFDSSQIRNRIKFIPDPGVKKHRILDPQHWNFK